MTGSNNDAWPTADVDRLKDLWVVKGWSAGQIESAMPRYSRSGILGKVHRLKLTRAPTGKTNEKRVRKAKPERPKKQNPATAWIGRAPVVEVIEQPPAEPCAGISMLQLNNSTTQLAAGRSASSAPLIFASAALPQPT